MLAAALLLAFAASAGGAPASSAAKGRMPRLVFPVIGPVSFQNDFGDPRGRLSHQGNDLMAPKKSIVVAAENGKIKFWTRSASAGCMLYLYGASGTTYQYIHLNNDRTMRNDNRGRCGPGTAFARGLKNGSRVSAGQPIGFVGDSGDANGGASHLHFEIHPRGARAVCPYAHLKKARVLLFAAKSRTQVSLTLKGKLVDVDPGRQILSMTMTELTSSTGTHLANLSRPVTLALPPTTLVIDSSGSQVTLDELDLVTPGSIIELATTSARATLAVQQASPRALIVFSVTIPALS